MYLSIIIPAYNEEERIGKTLEAVARFLKKEKYSAEIIVVDNGSTDRTKEIVNSYTGHIPELRILDEKSYGKGWAVKQGMLRANGRYRLFTDADNSTDITQVKKLLSYTKKHDVVVSSRRIRGANVVRPQKGIRAALGNLFTFIVHIIVPVHVKDTQNGFKLFTNKAAEEIFAHQTIFYWAFDVEILALAEKLGYKVKEVPIRYVNDERTHVRIKGMIRMLFEVILVRLHLMTRDYESSASK